MNIGKTINQMEEASRLGMYHNFKYKNERKNKKRLILDTAFAECEDDIKPHVKNIIGKSDMNKYPNSCIPMNWWGDKATTFKINLTTPLIIDKDCDVFIEQLTIWGGVGPTCDLYHQNLYINIDKFNNEVHTNNLYDNYYILPNESQDNKEWESKDDKPCITEPFIFKSKKLNYFASSTSKEITDLTLTIMTEKQCIKQKHCVGENDSIKLGSIFRTNHEQKDDKNGRCLLELIIVEKE